jgi:hypothetical protein
VGYIRVSRRELILPRYQIPKSAGQFEILTSRSGTPLVWNRKSGKGKVSIPCRDLKQAKEVIEKLKDLKNGGELWF